MAAILNARVGQRTLPSPGIREPAPDTMATSPVKSNALGGVIFGTVWVLADLKIQICVVTDVKRFKFQDIRRPTSGGFPSSRAMSLQADRHHPNLPPTFPSPGADPDLSLRMCLNLEFDTSILNQQCAYHRSLDYMTRTYTHSQANGNPDV